MSKVSRLKSKVVFWHYLGIIEYDSAMEIMKNAHEGTLKDTLEGYLFLLQHSPVVTIGRFGKMEDVFISEKALEKRGIILRKTPRGGGVTYHGPGQLVGYPVLRLDEFNIGVKQYVAMLERVLVLTLREFGINAEPRVVHPGVWAENKKIASIGINVSHGITSHGFALNVSTELRSFKLISPCELSSESITSMKEITQKEYSLDKVAEVVAECFSKVFKCKTIKRTLDFRL